LAEPLDQVDDLSTGVAEDVPDACSVKAVADETSDT
jgi:hypothetical protein